MMLWVALASFIAADPGTIDLRDNPPKGILVAAGGGTTTVEIVDKTVDLAGGRSAIVAILAEANPDNGPGSLAMWRRADVAKVTLIDPKNTAQAEQILNEANLIWISGGLQGLFMNRVREIGLEEVIRRRYQEGAIIAGTSAGAAVLSKVMIGGRSDLDSLKAGTAPYLMNGLGLWPDVIVDQHFLQKGRFNRLALATIDYPELVGIGIDEETATIVRGNEIEVIGENNVTIIDARNASREELIQGQAVASRHLTVHILRAGMKINLHE